MFWANLLIVGMVVAICIDLTRSLVKQATQKRVLSIEIARLDRYAAIRPGMPAVKPKI